MKLREKLEKFIGKRIECILKTDDVDKQTKYVAFGDVLEVLEDAVVLDKPNDFGYIDSHVPFENILSIDYLLQEEEVALRFAEEEE